MRLTALMTGLSGTAAASTNSHSAALPRHAAGGWDIQGVVFFLPCPQLRQLHANRATLQLEPADGSPGLLHDCTALTALHLQHCKVQDSHAAFAAIAALPELRNLVVEELREKDGKYSRVLNAELCSSSCSSH
jgi:hypothetical protein